MTPEERAVQITSDNAGNVYHLRNAIAAAIREAMAAEREDAKVALAAARALASAMISSGTECSMCGAYFVFEDHEKDCPVPVILTPATQERAK